VDGREFRPAREERTMAARATATRDDARAETTTSDHRNDVLLVGRVTSPAAERTLPSGDVLVTWRIVVDRPPRARSGERRSPTVDTLDCVAWRADVRRTAVTWSVGDTVELNGSLRRRFWRATSGPVSRTEVEVTRARRVAKAE
jgi:single-strand DNA-binding protein